MGRSFRCSRGFDRSPQMVHVWWCVSPHSCVWLLSNKVIMILEDIKLSPITPNIPIITQLLAQRLGTPYPHTHAHIHIHLHTSSHALTNTPTHTHRHIGTLTHRNRHRHICARAPNPFYIIFDFPRNPAALAVIGFICDLVLSLTTPL